MMVGREEQLEDTFFYCIGPLIFLILLWVFYRYFTVHISSYRKQSCHGMMFVERNRSAFLPFIAFIEPKRAGLSGDICGLKAESTWIQEYNKITGEIFPTTRVYLINSSAEQSLNNANYDM